MINIHSMSLQKYILILIMLASNITGQAQTKKPEVKKDKDVINLVNPSFEDYPHVGQKGGLTISGWYDCGRELFPSETPPDVQPSIDPSSPFFGVNTRPYDGRTYVGMVVRDNDSWESLSQRLSSPLVAGKCYDFSVYLCRSESYMSATSTNDQTILPFTTPIQLRVWGGSSFCNKMELLHSTSSVSNTTWAKYQMRFEPKQNINYIMLEAFYKTPVLFPYNGNILMDNASAIVEVNCKTPLPVKEKKDIAEVKPKPVQDKPVNTKTNNNTRQDSGNSFSKLNAKDLKTGQTIRIDKLYFAADSSIIDPKSYSAIDEIHSFMSDNPNIVVEIGGHTNDVPDNVYCDRLSEARAKAVYDYLILKGISAERLQYKGYGKRMPVTTNKTTDGRRRNQRVEIKILSLNG